MLEELRTFLATCDNCGYSQKFTCDKEQYPPLWGKAIQQQHIGSRMEELRDALCPDCIINIVSGRNAKYAKSTVHKY